MQKEQKTWVIFAPIALYRPSAYALHLRGVVFAALQKGKHVFLCIPRTTEHSQEAQNVLTNLFTHPALTIVFYNNPLSKLNFLGALFGMPALFKLLKRSEPETLYIRMGLLTFVLHYLVKAFYKTYTISEHNGWLQEELKSLIHMPFGTKFLCWMGKKLQVWDACQADIVRVMTPELKACLEKENIPPSKMIVAPNGADTALFTPKDRNDSLAKYALDVNRFYIGFIGSLSKWQGVHHLMDVFAKMAPRFSDIDLIIAGDGLEYQNLKTQATLLGLGVRVRFLGAIPIQNVPDVVSCFDIAVAPMQKSLYTVSGSSKIKIRDYAACGRCILTGDTNDHKAFEQDNVLVTYRMDDHNDMYEKLVMLYQNPEQREILQKNSRKYAKEKLSWAIVLKDVFENGGHNRD